VLVPQTNPGGKSMVTVSETTGATTGGPAES